MNGSKGVSDENEIQEAAYSVQEWYSRYYAEFDQKYLNIRTCSKYDFRHTHHYFLEYNFLAMRSYYYQCVQTFISNSKSNRLVDNMTLLRCCQYFGFAKEEMLLLTIEQQFNHHYIDTIGATQQFPKLFEQRYIQRLQTRIPNNILNIPFILIECKQNIQSNHKYDDIIFIRFMYYITIIECGLLCIHKSNNSRKCSTCRKWNTVRRAFLAYLMLFCTSNIHRKLINFSEKALIDSLKFNTTKLNNKLKNNTFYVDKAKYLKKTLVSLEDIKQKGLQYAMYSIEYYFKMMRKTTSANGLSEPNSYQNFHKVHKNCSEDRFCHTYNNLMYFVIGKIYSLVLNNHAIAMGFLVVSSCTAFSLYQRCIALRALAKNCYLSDEYLIGKKILNVTFLLCNGYILPIFVEKEFYVEKRKFRKKLKKVMCAKCNKTDITLKCCTGCMATFYCSKTCQKCHWNQFHRKTCNKVWLKWYKQDKADKGWHGAYEALGESLLAAMGLWSRK